MVTEEEERVNADAGQEPARSWLDGDRKRRGDSAERRLISARAMMINGRRNFMVVTVRIQGVLARRLATI